MSKKSMRRKRMSDINVVPYIDVMLVLLVIFMVTAPMMQEGVVVDLPKASASPVNADGNEEKIVVTVDREGRYSIAEGGLPPVILSAAAVTNKVQEMLATRDNKQVYVRGDGTVDYSRVVQAMAAIQAAGASSIGLMTDPDTIEQ